MTRDRGAVRVSLDAESLTRAAAELFLSVVNDAVAARGRADIALTGGSSPQPMHRALATPEFAAQIPWAAVHIWFGDERAVPPGDPLSNYGAARDTLLAHVPLPPANVHRMQGEAPPDTAAAAYEAELRRHLAPTPGAVPALDLIWLGLGHRRAHRVTLPWQCVAGCDGSAGAWRAAPGGSRAARGSRHADVAGDQCRRARGVPDLRRGEGVHRGAGDGGRSATGRGAFALAAGESRVAWLALAAGSRCRR